MNFFLIIGGLGFVLFLISIFGGGEHDFDHDAEIDSADSDGNNDDGSSFFSYRTIVTFMTAFGAAGALAKHFGLSMLWSSVIGVVVGIAFGLFAWWLMRLAFRQQASSLVTSADILGKTAIVNIQITGSNLGEISVEAKGQRKCYQAKSVGSVTIAENTAVKIIEDKGVFVLVEPVV